MSTVNKTKQYFNLKGNASRNDLKLKIKNEIIDRVKTKEELISFLNTKEFIGDNKLDIYYKWQKWKF